MCSGSDRCCKDRQHEGGQEGTTESGGGVQGEGGFREGRKRTCRRKTWWGKKSQKNDESSVVKKEEEKEDNPAISTPQCDTFTSPGNLPSPPCPEEKVCHIKMQVIVNFCLLQE